MTSQALAHPRHEITRIRAVPPRAAVARTTMLVSVPTRHSPMPIASTQGTLALDLDPHPELPRTPELRIVTGGRSDLDAFAARFSQAVVEVIGGDRGLHQLLRWTSPEVYADLVLRTTALAEATGTDQRVRRLRAQVRSVHLFCPRADAAELSVHVRHGERSRALAARIELLEGRWQCTALEFG